MTTPTADPRYKLVFTVPPSSAEACKSAIFAKGKYYSSPNFAVIPLSLGKKKGLQIPKANPPTRSSIRITIVALIHNIGAGSYPGGTYSLCCHETRGTSQFLPSAGAHPAIGKPGELEKLEETRVEVLCVGRDVMVGAVEALKRAHPYEEPAYEVYKLEDV